MMIFTSFKEREAGYGGGPVDPVVLLRARRAYVAAKLRQAEEEFRSTQSAWSQQAAFAARYSSPTSPIPGPPPNAKAILLDLKAIASKWRSELIGIDEQLSQTTEAFHRRQLAEQAGEQRESIAVLHGEISSLELD